jgi:hypothetical protein
VEVGDAYNVLIEGHGAFARFYGPAANLDMGAGMILDNAAFPLFDDEDGEFAVAEGLVYVVSHECDIAQANDRPFNDAALICPIIPLQNMMDEYLADLSEEKVTSFVHQLSSSRVDRAAYIPTIADRLPHGGVLYFNTLTSTSVTELTKPGVIVQCAVSEPGLKYIDDRLHRALLKPKDQRLPLAGW